MKLISYLIIFIFILTSGCTPIKKGKVNFINNKKIPAKVIPKKEKYSKYEIQKLIRFLELSIEH